MANVSVTALCGGTETKISAKTKNPYQITKFVEVPSMVPFEVFGDLGLPVSMTPVQFEFECGITGLSNVKVLSGSLPGAVPVAAAKSAPSK
jgi:hypothetical protein